MDPANLALTGQATCLAALRRVLQSGGFGHAVLLASYDEVAMDAVAGWCTKHIVCTAQQLEACGKCAGCTSLKHQEGLMLFRATLGDRSAYSVEDMRAVRKYLAMRSGQVGRRVVRIDNIESCTIAAANALLKVLEEPGMDVVFILTTAALGRVLPTIRSRTMLYRLQPVPRAEMERVLLENGVSASVVTEVVTAAPGQLGRAAALTASADALATLHSIDALAAEIAIQTPTARFRSLAAYLAGKQEAETQRQQVRALFAAFARRVATDPWIQQRLGRLLKSLQDLQTNSQPKLILEAFIA